MERRHQKFTNYQFIRQSAVSKTKTKQKKNHRKFAMANQTDGNYFERLNTNDYARIQCIRNWITWHIGMLDLCLFGLIITETQS